MTSGKRRSSKMLFEPDNEKRFKRYRRLLLDDCSKDAKFDVDGTFVPVHRAILEASSSQFAKLGNTIPISGKRVEVVRDFMGYLYGIDVFDDGELSVDNALDLAQLFIRFGIDVGAKRAAKYCASRCSPEQLNKMCNVFAEMDDVRDELTKLIIDNIDYVDVSRIDATMMMEITACNGLSHLKKAIAVCKWKKANPGKLHTNRLLFKTLDIEKVCDCAEEMQNELKMKDVEIIALRDKLYGLSNHVENNSQNPPE